MQHWRWMRSLQRTNWLSIPAIWLLVVTLLVVIWRLRLCCTWRDMSSPQPSPSLSFPTPHCYCLYVVVVVFFLLWEIHASIVVSGLETYTPAFLTRIAFFSFTFHFSFLFYTITYVAMDRSHIVSPGGQERRLVLLLPRSHRYLASGQERLHFLQRGNQPSPTCFANEQATSSFFFFF